MDLSILAAAVGGVVSGGVAAAAPIVLLLRRARAQTRELDQTLATVRYDAEHDSVTGLASRKAFYAQAACTLAASRPRQRMAVAVMDIDGFKQVNDTLGHGTGDVVLHMLGRRLRDAVGAQGLVSRLGGDEFAAVAPLADDQAVDLFAAALHAAGEVPVDLDDITVHVGLSVGVVPVDQPADLAVLLGRADNAMYRAKGGRLGAAVYDPDLDDDAAPMPGSRPPARTRDLTIGDSALVALGEAVSA